MSVSFEAPTAVHPRSDTVPLITLSDDSSHIIGLSQIEAGGASSQNQGNRSLSVPELPLPEVNNDLRLTKSESPPSQPLFQTRVAFDTFDNKDATDFSLTLRAKHKDYKYNRLSRTFLCGTDNNEYSELAVEWLLEELVEDGDEIICLRVIDPGSRLASSDTAIQERLYRDEAHSFLKHIVSKNRSQKKLSIILEFAVGKVPEMIRRMIQIYEPAMLIVGTKGRSMEGFKGLLPGSVSKYCLQHSPIPVVVVRPTYKRERRRAKREADPSRKSYLEVLMKSHDDSSLKVYEQGSTKRGSITPALPAYLATPERTVSPPQPVSPKLAPVESRNGRTRSRSPFPSRILDSKYGRALSAPPIKRN